MKYVLFILLSSALLSCGNNQQQEEKDKEAAVFYPFPQYLQQQVAYVDSMPLAIEYLHSVDGKRVDSNYFDKKAFAALVQSWLEDDPNKASLKADYQEQSFQDLTLNTVTFSITTTNAGNRLQQADILLQPDTKKVKNVILKRSWTGGDSTVVQTVFWVHNMKCQVSEEVTFADGKTYTQTKEFTWDRPIQ